MMWERRLGVRIAGAKHEIHAAGASLEVAGALGLPLGALSKFSTDSLLTHRLAQSVRKVTGPKMIS